MLDVSRMLDKRFVVSFRFLYNGCLSIILAVFPFYFSSETCMFLRGV